MPTSFNAVGVFNEANSFVFRRIGMIIRLGWLGACLVLAGYGVGLVTGSNGPGMPNLGEIPGVSWAGGVIDLMLSAVGLAPVSVVICRLIVSGEKVPAGAFYFKFGGVEKRYAATIFALGVISTLVLRIKLQLLPVADQSTLPTILLIPALILWIWLNVRIATLLPMIANCNRLAPRAAFSQTHGIFWPIFRVLLLAQLYLGIWLIPAAVITGFGFVITGSLVDGTGPLNLLWIACFIPIALWGAYAGSVFLVIQSILYRRLTCPEEADSDAMAPNLNPA